MGTATKLAADATLLDQLKAARKLTDELFQVVRPDALYDRPIAERHRIIFYIGHLEAFDWNLFRGQRPELKSFHVDYDRLFAFGIDPVDGQLPADQPQDWPSVADVDRYVRRVRHDLDILLNSVAADEPRQNDSTPLAVLLHTAIEHRLMHAETLAYMFHRLPFDKKIPQQQLDAPAGQFSPRMIEIPAGLATLGLRREAEHPFGWDNEFDAHQVDVPSFRIDKFMVTNGEYAEFVLDGGYRRPEFWVEDDWEWIQHHGIEQPAFWVAQGNPWLYRGMFEHLPLPLEWPVYVSQAEAKAYARWAGKALPTEGQWHRAAYGQPDGAESEYPLALRKNTKPDGNFDFLRWDAAPVASPVNNTSAFGAVGMLGNGWEWTSSEFAPFPGFQPFPFYPGYSANFFDGKHFVMKGGSPRTAAVLLRKSFRNWFQSYYQYAYAGFRCVSSGA